MEVIGNLLAALGIVALQAWCVLCIYAPLKLLQAAGLESDTPSGRAAAALCAIAGLAFALWSVYRVFHVKRKARR